MLKRLLLALAMTLACVCAYAQQATQLPPGKACFTGSVGLSGMISTLGAVTSAGGGIPGTYSVSLTGGSGSGATATVLVAGDGTVSSVTLTNPGVGYAVGDALSASPSAIGGVTSLNVPVAGTAISGALAGGTVTFYVPGTTTPKSTWQDAGQTTLNTNPVNLDGNGCALIFGVGNYREILKDSLGNLVWDQVVSSVAQVNPFYAGLASGSANVITVTDPTFTSADGQGIIFKAFYTNTSTVTLNGIPVKKNSASGPVVLASGEIAAGNMEYVIYNSTASAFILTNPLSTLTATDIEITDYGAVGDGTTINNAAFQNAFTAAASGGRVHVPCGVWKITATPSMSLASGAHGELAGDGSDCAVILVSGVVNGPTFNLASQWSSARVSNLTIETDQPGATKCLVWNGNFTNTNSAYAAASALENVTFRGVNTYTSSTQYCGSGFWEKNVSNISIINEMYQGPTAFAGIAVNLQGGGSGSYSVQINIANSNLNNCATAVQYGDWVQGVQMVNNNITGCSNGVIAVSSPSGGLSGLLLTNNQINTFSCDICVNDTAFDNAQIVNNQIIVEPNGIGVKVQGTNYIVADNEIDGVVPTPPPNSIGIVIGSTFGNGGSTSGNHIIGFDTAIQVSALNQADAKIDINHFVSNTTDYNVSTSSRGTTINDTQPRIFATLPSCGTHTKFSKFMIADSPTSTFNATVTVGAGVNFLGVNCDGSRYYVD